MAKMYIHQKQIICYREIKREELDLNLFKYFIRRQIVNKCWRKTGGEWVIKEALFIPASNEPGDCLEGQKIYDFLCKMARI